MMNLKTSSPPKIFISYSWDCPSHEQWVLELATTLRKNGVNVILDKWELTQSGQLLPNFMERSIAESQRVICVMTPNYKIKTDQLTGGVGYEYSIITAELFSNVDTAKFIPLIRTGEDHDAIPVALKGRKYIDMRRKDNIEELLRDIYQKPKYEKPPLGDEPSFTAIHAMAEAVPEKYPFHICLSMEPIDIESVYRSLSEEGLAFQMTGSKNNTICTGLATVEEIYPAFIRVYEHLLYYDWKKRGVIFPPAVKIIVIGKGRKWPALPDCPLALTGFMANDLYEQLPPNDKKSFTRLNDKWFEFDSEEIFGHVLRDDNYHLRNNVLRRFAYLWLLADQLPTGSWGYSVAGWMKEIWRDLPGVAYNERIEDEGGFETTVLNMELLTRLFSYDELIENKAWTKGCKYLMERFDGSGGFGPVESVGRTGIQIVSSIRHTALVTCLLGKLIASEECVTSAFNDFFVKGVEKLFIKMTEKRDGKTMLMSDKRNAVLQYFLYWHIIRKMRKDPKIKTLIENNLDIDSITKAWEQSKFYLEEQVLIDTYKARGSDSDTVTKLVVPYCNFSRMEVYSFLTSAFFLDPGMSNSVKLRYKKGIEFIMNQYMKEFGQVTDRYSGDFLRPKMRGIKNAYNAEGKVDLGCTAMLLRVLRDDNITGALWEGDRPVWHPRMVYYLNEDLLDNFDRFIVCPDSYDATNAGMLANCLAGDSGNALRGVLNIQPDDACEETGGYGYLSAESIFSHFRELLQTDRRKAQISSASLRHLISTKRPARYAPVQTGMPTGWIEWPLSHKAKSILTSIAYNESVVEYTKAHISPERENTIRGIVSRMEKFLGGLVGKNILDAGCGLGDYAAGFYDRGAHVTGIDISPDMIRNARDRNANVDFQVMDMLDIPDEWDNLYDGILCITVFQHIPIEVSVSLMRRFHRILRPGGVLRIDIQIDREQGFDPDLRYIESYRNRIDAVEKLQLEQIGFKVVDFKEWNLKKGDNSFKRYTEFKFVEFWIRKI
jgi:SAM-dependent methyltransferase